MEEIRKEATYPVLVAIRGTQCPPYHILRNVLDRLACVAAVVSPRVRELARFPRCGKMPFVSSVRPPEEIVLLGSMHV